MQSSQPSDTRFTWRGIDATGTNKRGKTIAMDTTAARAALKRDGITVLELTGTGPAPPPKAKAADVTLFTRQLAGLLRAGLPLAPCLDLIAQTPSRGGLPRIVGSVARDITQGVAFSEALARHPACFNALYCQLVSVGELAGALPTVLARLAEDRERAGAQRAKLRAALTYPVAVLLLSLAITAGLLIGVVPTFKTIFDGFGAKLPAPAVRAGSVG
jgi:type IV pilus assembly protein PilC